VVAEAAALAAAVTLLAATALAAEAVALAAAAADVAPADEAALAALFVTPAMARAMAMSRSAMDVPVAAEACSPSHRVKCLFICLVGHASHRGWTAATTSSIRVRADVLWGRDTPRRLQKQKRY
jgi:hypothetical protein